jgi:hypothetical protein
MTILLATSRARATPAPVNVSAAGGIEDAYVQVATARSLDISSGITTWSTGKPTTIEERLYDARAALKVAAAQVAMHLSAGQRKRLFAELDGLLDPEEWPVDQAIADQRSFGTYLRMLIHLRPAREPSLGLSQRGNLLAGWISGRDRLSLEFGPRDQVRWVVTVYTDDVRESAAGDTTIGRLPAVLAAYGPERWFDGQKGADQGS